MVRRGKAFSLPTTRGKATGPERLAGAVEAALDRARPRYAVGRPIVPEHGVLLAVFMLEALPRLGQFHPWLVAD